MANYQLEQTGAEVQALLNAVESPDTTPAAGSSNLITSGAVQAAVAGVSAEVTALGQKVDDLDVEINGGDVSSNLEIAHTASGKYMSAGYGGAMVASSSMDVAFFQIAAGAKLVISIPKAGNPACYILGYTDITGDSLTGAQVDEVLDSVGTWAAYNRTIDEAPNHNYLAVTYAAGTTPPTVVQTIHQDASVATKDELTALEKQIDGELENLEGAYEQMVDLEVSPNLYDKSQGLLGGYINSDGNISPMTSSYYYSKPVPVQAGHYYLLAGRGIPQAQYIRCLNSSGNPLKVLIASTGEGYSSWSLPNEAGTSWATNGQFLVPSGAVSVQFNVTWNNSGDDNTIQLIDLGTEYSPNPATPEYQPFGQKTYTLKESALPDTARMADAPLLRNKRIFLFGASCASNSTAGVKGYGELIAEMAGIPYRGFLYDSADGNTQDVPMASPNFTNYAKDGTCLRVVSGRSDGIVPRIKRHIAADAEVDYVVLMFPANDAAQQYRNIGVMEQSYTAEFDTDTQLGALEEVCRYVTEIGRPFKFGCIIAWDITWVPSDFYDAYIPVLEKWGIPYLDLRRTAGFDIKNCAAHRRLYSLTGDDYASWDATTIYNLDAKVKYGGVLYKSTQDNNVGHIPTDTDYWMFVSSDTGDGTHLNSAGNEIVVGKILSFIESL